MLAGKQIFFFLGMMLSGSLSGSLLHEAREHWQKGAFDAAGNLYQQIKPRAGQPPGNPWQEKVIDAIRYQLIANHPLEALKLIILLQRMGQFAPDLMFYQSLALYELGGCPMSLLTFDQTYRSSVAISFLLKRYYKKDFVQEIPENDRGDTAYYSSGEIPLLAEIPFISILRGRGCRFHRLLFDVNAKPALLSRALSHLIALQKSFQSSPITVLNQHLVDISLLRMAIDLGNSDLQISIQNKIARWSWKNWLDIPHIIREGLFEHLITAAPALAKTQPMQQIPYQLINRLSGSFKLYWLNKIPFNTLPKIQRDALIKTLVADATTPHKAWLYLYLARTHFFKNEGIPCLQMIRKMFNELALQTGINQLGTLDSSPLVQQATQMAKDILLTYLFDDRVFGAVSETLPKPEITQTLIEMWIRQALSGNTKGYKRVQTLLKERGRFAQNWIKIASPLLDAIIKRQSKTIDNLLNPYYPPRRAVTGKRQALIHQILRQALTLDLASFSAIKPLIKGAYLATADSDRKSITPAELLKAIRARLDGEESDGINLIASPLSYAGSIKLTDIKSFLNPYQKVQPYVFPLALFILLKPVNPWDRDLTVSLSTSAP